MSRAANDIVPFRPESPGQWRRWLEEHHEKEREVWCAIKRKKSPMRGVLLEEAIDEALCWGWIDSRMYSRDADHFILRFTPRSSKSAWGQANRKRVMALIESSRMRPAGLAAVEAARRSGAWDSAYTLKENRPLPQDLMQALAEDSAVLKKFRALSNTARNMFIIWVTGAKKPGTREARVRKTVAMVAAGERLGGRKPPVTVRPPRSVTTA